MKSLRCFLQSAKVRVERCHSTSTLYPINQALVASHEETRTGSGSSVNKNIFESTTNHKRVSGTSSFCRYNGRLPVVLQQTKAQTCWFSSSTTDNSNKDIPLREDVSESDLFLAKRVVSETEQRNPHLQQGTKICNQQQRERQQQQQRQDQPQRQQGWTPSVPLQSPAGKLFDENENDDDNHAHVVDGGSKKSDFIPQIPLNERDGINRRKRVLVLCTGGTLTMRPDPSRGGSLAPVQGVLTNYLLSMQELQDRNMPEVVAHEYTPLVDSSDLGPSDWALIAKDIKTNYYHFDGFVILMGTDTMAYTATALSFMLENLGKPVVFTGSQIPFGEPYNDARRNLIMALIFACRDTLNEVSIFFHDRLLRACRSTKVNTTKLLAFDSPNQEPLAKIGINIDENEHLFRPHPRGALRIHSRMDTRLLTLRLVPGFDDAMMKHIIQAATATNLKGLVLQLYGTGNIPSVKDDFVQVLADATDSGVLVVASTQCYTGAVMMGHYATGRALIDAGVVSANDMTLEAISCKLAYLFGRGDLTFEEIGSLMEVSLRGEVTPAAALPPPPLSTSYQRASRKGKKFL